MKLLKCAKGHFYDSTKFTKCPHCAAEDPMSVRTGPIVFSEEQPLEQTPGDVGMLNDYDYIYGNRGETVRRVRLPEDPVVSTVVSSADIYFHGATVTRTGEVTLHEGENRIYITGISSSAIRESVRLVFPEQRSREAVQVLDELPPLEWEMTEEQKRALEELTREQSRKREQLQELRQQEGLWKKTGEAACQGSHSLQEITAYLEALPERIAAFRERENELEHEIKTLEQKQGEYFKQGVDELTQDGPCVVTKLISSAEGSYRFFLEYREPNVSWNSSYELSVPSLAGELYLEQTAKVSQWTGEDWKEVALRLYTHDPVMVGKLPSYEPIYLSLLRGSSPSFPLFAAAKSRPSADPYCSLPGAFLEDSHPTTQQEMPELSVMQSVPRAKETNQSMSMTMEYEIASPVSVESGMAGCSVKMRKLSTPAGFCCYVYPRVSTQGFLTAILPDAAGFDLLQGEAEIYLENRYLGSTTIDPAEIEGDYELLLGMDQQVQVRRVLLKKYRSGNMLRGQETICYEYGITVSSRKKQTVSLVILDQIPVSQEQSIQVTLTECSEGTYNAETGGVRWEKALLPGDMISLKLAYQITKPAKQQMLER